jgi:hypothetical protein
VRITQLILLEMEIDAATIQVNVYLLIVLVGLILVLVGYSLWMGKRNTQKLIDEHINIDPISGYGNFARFVDKPICTFIKMGII